MSICGNMVYLGKGLDPQKDFVYVGGNYNANYVYNSNGDTCLALLSSGTLTFTKPGDVDIFLIGGGGAGGANVRMYYKGVGAGYAGGSTSISGNGVTLIANGGGGGSGASTSRNTAGTGSGGAGTSANCDGANGVGAFGLATGVIFGSGGGGGYSTSSSNWYTGIAGNGAATARFTMPQQEVSGYDAPNNRGGGGGAILGDSGTGHGNATPQGGAGGYYINQTIKVAKGNYSISIGNGGSRVYVWCGPSSDESKYQNASGMGGSGIILIKAHK